jgi:hypothetical protein
MEVLTKKSRGLGDTVDKITTVTGIKFLVNSVTEECGCQARQEWLNGKVPYDGKNVQRIINFFKK